MKVGRKAGLFCLFGAMLCWSLTGLWTKLLAEENPYSSSGWRGIVGFLALFAYGRYRGGEWSVDLVFTGWGSTLSGAWCALRGDRSEEAKAAIAVFGPGLGYSISLLSFIYAVNLKAPVATVATFYLAVSVITVVGWNLVFGEKPRWYDWGVCGIMLIAFALVGIDRPSANEIAALAAALLGGVLSGFATIGGKSLPRKQLYNAYTRGMFLLSFAVLGGPAQPPSSLAHWGYAIAFGVGSTAVPIALYTVALSCDRISRMEASVAKLVLPPASTLWVFLSFGDWPKGWAQLAIAILFGAAAFHSVMASRKVGQK